jgi:hypothetical protein
MCFLGLFWRVSGHFLNLNKLFDVTLNPKDLKIHLFDFKLNPYFSKGIIALLVPVVCHNYFSLPMV